MNLQITDKSAATVDADALVVGYFSDLALEGAARQLDEASGGVLQRLIEAGEMTGKPLEITRLLALPGVRAGQVLVVGLGDRGKLQSGLMFRAAAAAAKQLATRPRARVAYYLPEQTQPELVESSVCGAFAGCQGQDLYRAEKNLHPFGELLWAGGEPAWVDSGRILGESVNLTRRLVNEPASSIYPESFAETARTVAAEFGLEVEIWDEQRLKAERCGALLAVAGGSSRPPRLVVVRYPGGKPGQAPLALIGKGVTFDSGGLSLKPTDGMKTMKADMAGAATVLGAMQAIARLQLPVNAIGLMGLVENMVSGSSYKLGDVLTARSGKTIEVLNTDAEGRLVLADVLSVALEQQPARMIDLATLTGACLVALGTDVAGLMTNNADWLQSVKSAAERCGEPAWELPMFAEYREQIRSPVADIKNVGDGRWGGAITAAKFLEEFVGDVPWVHIDIAGPAFLEAPKPWLDAGGSGAFVRTLVEVARGFQHQAQGFQHQEG